MREILIEKSAIQTNDLGGNHGKKGSSDGHKLTRTGLFSILVLVNLTSPGKNQELPMSPEELSTIYREYVDCLNRKAWADLDKFVHIEVEHNGRKIGLSGYREMLESDFRAIPDLRFEIRLLVAQPPCIASRLHFDCTPAGDIFGLPVNGRRVQFDENVIYEFVDRKIRRVWSVIDKAAIAAQI